MTTSSPLAPIVMFFRQYVRQVKGKRDKAGTLENKKTKGTPRIMVRYGLVSRAFVAALDQSL